MAPATDAIMGSLPEAKMSVGSAINDTTRVAGGALGVAVLGSLLSSGYRGAMIGPRSAERRTIGSRGGRALALRRPLPRQLARGGALDAFLTGMQRPRWSAVSGRGRRRARRSPPCSCLLKTR